MPLAMVAQLTMPPNTFTRIAFTPSAGSVSCSVDIVLHEERLLGRRLRARDVLAARGLGVSLRARQQQRLRLLVVLVLAAPGLDARRLQRPRVAERQPARASLLHLVDLVEVDGGILLGDAAREESDARHARRQAALQ